MPMGFCYPGKAKGGDAPPRKECAPQWHDQILAHLPRTRLTLLVGSYAQRHYLPRTRSLSLTERVRHGEQVSDALGAVIPLPHPSWRVRMWMGRNAWFETDVVPRIRSRVGSLV